MAGIAIFIGLGFLSIFVDFNLGLQCYSCNQRVQNATNCVSSVIEDCSIIYSQKPTICMKSVQRSFDGQSPWVLSQCYALGMPTDPLLNQCELKEVRGIGQQVLYTLEICACTQNLCNGGNTIIPGIPVVPPQIIPPVVPPRPILPPQPVAPPSLGVTTGLQCYKCNQRFQNMVNCRNPVVENCDQVFPGQATVCGKRVQVFANGDPPWVFAQCELRNGPLAIASSWNGIPSTDTCRSVSDRLNTIESCICSTPLCNNAVGAFGANSPLLPTLSPDSPIPEIIPSIPGGVNQLHCYKCNERLVNRTTCANRTVEDCWIQFPNQPVACVRSVQTFSDGQAPWVIERCQIRALFPEAKPNDCWSQPLTGNSGVNGTDYLEFCTCISDLCNTEAIMSTNVTLPVIG